MADDLVIKGDLRQISDIFYLSLTELTPRCREESSLYVRSCGNAAPATSKKPFAYAPRITTVEGEITTAHRRQKDALQDT